MTRYDDLRRKREAEFTSQQNRAKAVEKAIDSVTINLPPVAKPVTKPPVTKPISVTKPADVRKPNKGGRPSIGDKPMTAAERMRRYRARRRALKAFAYGT